MRNYFLNIGIIFILTCLTIPSFALERIPDFYIKSRQQDSKLHPDSSEITFKFSAEGIVPSNQINIGINNESFYAKLNADGMYSQKIKNGTYKFYFYIPNHHEVITDSIILKSQESLTAVIRFTSNPIMVKPAKPVIYLYPEKETEVSVHLNVIGELGFTYPTYNNGWNGIASPSGEIKMNNKSYNYLFWDSEMPKSDLKYEKTGFLVSSDTLLSFLENSLNQFGLSSKESADFITYWYPQMIKNNQNHIHFLFNDACDTYAALNITPQPQLIFRIGMLWSEAKTNFIPEKQNIISVQRNGFTVIEWGGVEINNLFEKEN